jgi:hypothetical protein
LFSKNCLKHSLEFNFFAATALAVDLPEGLKFKPTSQGWSVSGFLCALNRGENAGLAVPFLFATWTPSH